MYVGYGCGQVAVLKCETWNRCFVFGFFFPQMYSTVIMLRLSLLVLSYSDSPISNMKNQKALLKQSRKHQLHRRQGIIYQPLMVANLFFFWGKKGNHFLSFRIMMITAVIILIYSQILPCLVSRNILNTGCQGQGIGELQIHRHTNIQNVKDKLKTDSTKSI